MNPQKIKESLAKGFVLFTLTGTLVSKNPININKENIVYASTDLTDVKKNSIKELKGIYKKYNKSYYTSKNYNKLTKYYNKAVNLINNAKSLEKIESYLETYKVKLESIKPTKLIKYQNKMEKSLLKTYKSLISKYEYSDNNLQKIEDIKNEGLESIYSALTKTKSKKAKNSYINKIKEVKTLIDETKYSVICYIYSNNKLSDSEKSEIIETINNSDNVEEIKQIGDDYGFVEEEKVVITVDQIEKKKKELVKKYPTYTEDEIRIFVATANMDYVKDDEIFDIFKVNSKEELEEKKNKLDKMLETLVNVAIFNKSYSYNPENFDNSYENLISECRRLLGKTYDEMIKINDLFIDKKMKSHAEYICELCRQIIFESNKITDRHELTNGYYASIKLTVYYYNRSKSQMENYPDDDYDRNIAINILDDKLTGGAGYIINYYGLYNLEYNGDYRLTYFTTDDAKYVYTKKEQILSNYDNFISKRLGKQKIKD